MANIMIFQLLICVAGFSTIVPVLSLPVESDPSENPRQPATSAMEFPYQILISQFEEGPKCGGVLIAERFILTSATCVLEFGGIKKFLEEAILYGGGTSLLRDLGDVSDAVIHPKYTVNPTAFDVALVKYIPDEKGPQLNSTAFNGTWVNQAACIFTSWWSEPDTWPQRLVWQPVSLVQCSPDEPHMSCLVDNIPPFLQNDLGSPIVCEGLLTGLVPRGGGVKVMNLTSDYDWIMEAMTEFEADEDDMSPQEVEEEDTKLYLIKILQKLDFLTDRHLTNDSFTSWNNQIVIPLSYVLFAMVIFFFVLLFFIVLFTVVLVYYSKK